MLCQGDKNNTILFILIFIIILFLIVQFSNKDSTSYNSIDNSREPDVDTANLCPRIYTLKLIRYNEFSYYMTNKPIAERCNFVSKPLTDLYIGGDLINSYHGWQMHL